ncbi:MAG: alpha/beta fold hydrolase [Verrucomicrobiales bacterium]|nr:alpha/beta fold hydrolase [Verrucomicrobiales bacterium]
MKSLPNQTRRLVRWVLLGVAAVMVLVVLGAVILAYGWTQFARTLPPLKGWHRDRPRSEFAASDATASYDLTAYRKQEDQVFEELDTLIRGPWASEVDGRFNRFGAESVCNPARLLNRNWNRTYVLESPNPVGGALLLHGLSDSPYSLRAMAERLHGRGYTVVGLRVPGHGTCPGALAAVSWTDWTAAVRVAAAGVRKMIPEGAPLVLVGYSNGGALSVNYALEALEQPGLPKPQALVLFSPMIGINPLAKVTRFHTAIAAVSGDPRANWSALDAEIDPYKYGGWPMNASVQAWRMTQRVEERLRRLTLAGRIAELPPMIAFQSAIDSTVVVPRLVTELFDRIGTDRSELVLFDVNRAGWLENLVNLGFERKVEPLLRTSNGEFTLTLVTNESVDSVRVVSKSRRRGAWSTNALGTSWPPAVFSLSHVAVPFPEEDPVYGTAEATKKTGLPLGSLSVHGESGVLRISDSQVLRLRHNPFFGFTADHAVEWLGRTLAHP